MAIFALAAATFGFGEKAWAQTCTNMPAYETWVFCSSAATDSDVSIDLDNATIKLDADGWSGSVWGYHTGTGAINIKAEGGSVTTSPENASGVFGWHANAGNIDIKVLQGHAITTSSSNAHGIYGLHQGVGDIDIVHQGSAITTSGGPRSHGISGWHQGTGKIDINVQDSTIMTTGDESLGISVHHEDSGDVSIDVRDSSISTSGGPRSHGIEGQRRGAGKIDINVQDSTITTSGDDSLGILVHHEDSGDVSIDVRDSSISTSGGPFAHGIEGRLLGAGKIDINVQGGSITTSGAGVHGIFGNHWGSGSVDIGIQNAVIRATGLDAHGIRVGSFDENGVVRGSVGLDEEGYRRQSVMVNGAVRGGSGDAAGIFLAGGGRVVIGPHGRVSADSGIAVRASGVGERDGDLPGPRLHVDLTLNNRPLQEILQGGRIVNGVGTTTLLADGVLLYDGAAGATGSWAPNGAWDVAARPAEDGGLELVQTYAPRAALYESLPGLLLRLDAGAPVRRPEEPAWVQAVYGVGSGDPKHSRAGATYDFDRTEVRAGISRAWGNNWGGSVWLRRIQSEVKVDLPRSSGELELHGVGAGVQGHWRETEGLYVSGELSLTDFDVDADSGRHGRLVRDVGAELWQARLEAGYRMAQGESLALQPRAWAWHAEADVDDFTDAVEVQVSYADESRSAAGLGVLAEVTESEYTLYGSVDVESVFAGEETAVHVSGQELNSESKRTRVLAGMGGRWQGQRVTLRGGLRLADPGGRNQELSASFSLGGQF